MRRTFNYTGRQRIERQHIQLRVVDASIAELLLEVSLDLASYKFPLSSKVYVEVRGESTFARRELADPFAEFNSEQISFTEFASGETMYYYVRVVEPGGDGRMLGFADRVRLVDPSDVITDRDALLQVEWGNTGEEIWRVDMEALGPVMRISRRLQEHRDRIGSDPVFVGCVIPQAFRQVLRYAFDQAGGIDTDDDESWFNDWTKWMASYPALRPYVSQLDDLKDAEEIDKWISSVIEEFAALRTSRYASGAAQAFEARN